MTGEMTLSGIVLPIGGVKEKVLGAKRAGIKEVLLPADNEPNAVADLTPDILGDIKITYVRTLDEVLGACAIEGSGGAANRAAGTQGSDAGCRGAPRDSLKTCNAECAFRFR